MCQPPSDKINETFERLHAVLQTHKLPTSIPGRTRLAHAGEFMFMGFEGNRASFKHIDTRNYIALNPDNTLDVPVTKGPFMRGEFDNLSDPGESLTEETAQ